MNSPKCTLKDTEHGLPKVENSSVLTVSMDDRNDETTNLVVRVGLDPERVHDELADENLIAALFLASTEIESSLSFRLQREFEIESDEFEAMFGYDSVNTYYDNCKTLSLVSKEEQNIFKPIINKRNDAAHDLSYLHKLQENNDEKEEVRILLEKFCDLKTFPEDVRD